MGQQDGSFAHLGEHLKVVIQERGITVEKPAGTTGLSLGLIVHLLTGEQILTADVAFVLGDFFGVSPLALLNLQCHYCLVVLSD